MQRIITDNDPLDVNPGRFDKITVAGHGNQAKKKKIKQRFADLSFIHEKRWRMGAPQPTFFCPEEKNLASNPTQLYDIKYLGSVTK